MKKEAGVVAGVVCALGVWCAVRRRRCRIEVEKKVQVDGGLRGRIKACGGVHRGCRRIVDTYYDKVDRGLCYRDAWLRSRSVNGKAGWELKVGPGLGSEGHTAASYEEFCGRELLAKLREYFSGDVKFSRVTDLTAAGALTVLVRVASTRDTYRMPNGVIIDIDCTDEGHVVAEIEDLVATQEDVPTARSRIEDVCKVLDIPPDAAPAPGKMETALHMQCPDLLQSLRKKRNGKTL